jgi:hypothetical protein
MPRLLAQPAHVHTHASFQAARFLLLHSSAGHRCANSITAFNVDAACASAFLYGPGCAGWASLPARRTGLRRNPFGVFHYVSALQVRLIPSRLLVALAAHPAPPGPCRFLGGAGGERWWIRFGQVGVVVSG